MISIKSFLERRTGREQDPEVVGALLQMGRLLLDGMATHMVRGDESDLRILRRTLSELTQQLDQKQSAMGFLGISSDAAEALETYRQRTTAYLQAQNDEKNFMVAMLTDTIADLSGQTDASVSRLHAIEKQVEHASALDDIRVLRTSLGDCLLALRDAAAHQRNSSAATVERLQGHITTHQKQTDKVTNQQHFSPAEIDLMTESVDGPVESEIVSYVAVFKLQHADHITSRFGEQATQQMLAIIGTQLKTVVGPQDRLMRWKGTSFVIIINVAATLREIRSRLTKTVAAVGQQYIEVGSRTALLSIGVDWIVFQRADHPSLDSVFKEVDTFLANSASEPSLPPLVVKKGIGK